MDIEEIKKRLFAFGDFLDNMLPSRKKGKLSCFFTGYLECFNKLCYLQHILKENDIWIDL